MLQLLPKSRQRIDVTSSGNLFQNCAAATGKARPTDGRHMLSVMLPAGGRAGRRARGRSGG